MLQNEGTSPNDLEDSVIVDKQLPRARKEDQIVRFDSNDDVAQKEFDTFVLWGELL